MPPKGWTSKDQTDWLVSRIPEYHAAQKRDQVARFLKETYEMWFRAFPLRTEVLPNKPAAESLTAEEAKKVHAFLDVRKKQIKTWFCWRRLQLRAGPANGTSKRRPGNMGDNLIKMLNIVPERKEVGRVPQRIEAYQTLFRERIWTVMQQELENIPPASCGNVKTSLLALRRAVTQKMFDNEAPDILARVDEYIADWKLKNKPTLPVEDVSGGGEPEPAAKPERTPQQYQQAITILPQLMEKLVGACAEATGWSFMVLAGGPSPVKDGSLYMEQYNFGPKLQAGNSFSDGYADFEKNVSGPFSKHLMSCFPDHVQLARALPTTQINAMRLVKATESSETTEIDRIDAARSTPNDSSSTTVCASPHSTVSASSGSNIADHGLSASNTAAPLGLTLDGSGSSPVNNHGDISSLTALEKEVGADMDNMGPLDVYTGSPANPDLQALGFDLSDFVGLDYMDSAFTDLPQMTFPHTATIPVAGDQRSLLDELNSELIMDPVVPVMQNGTRCDGFVFPNENPAVGFMGPTPSPIKATVLSAIDHCTASGALISPTEPRLAGDSTATESHVIDPSTHAMGNISNNATQPAENEAVNTKGKRKLQELELEVENDNVVNGRPKRRVVAPARRDKTPELAGGLYKKRKVAD